MKEQRLIDLETKISFQEVLIEELRQTAHNQYLAIERIEKSLKLLTDRRGAEGEGVDPTHQKPPHY